MSIYQFEERRTCGMCLRYLFVVANIVLILVGAALIAVFVYLLVTQSFFVSAVLGTDMVVAACALLIAAGCLLFLLAIFGFISGIVDRICCYAVYFGLLIPIFMAIAAGVICAIVFKTWLTDQVRYKMISTLQTIYGVNLDNSWNRRVTNSWDQAQTQWQCCSVDDKSWYVYQKSQWYAAQPGTPGSDTNWKPLVPRSCCKLDSNGDISNSNLKMCQSNQNGPPALTDGSQYAGNYNNALNYRGCYQAAQDFLVNDNASWFGILVGVGSAVAILLLLVILFAILLFVTRKRDVKRTSFVAEYSQRSGSVLY